MRDELSVLAGTRRTGVLRDMVLFVAATRKWWLAPVFFFVVLFGLLIFLSGSAAAPFIYTLF